MKKIILFLCAVCTVNAIMAQTPVLVQNLDTGPDGSRPVSLTPWNNYLYFIADAHTKNDGPQLWRYNGGSPSEMILGTDLVSAGLSMAIFNNKIYFAGKNFTVGAELFAYDGSNPPTLVADINTLLSASSSPENFVVSGGKLYFTATTYTTGAELYSYDGINPPKLYDIAPGSTGSRPSRLTDFNGKLYFAAQGKILTVNPQNDSLSQFQNNGSGFCNTVAGGSLYFVGAGDALYSFSGSGAPLQLTSSGTNDIRRVFRLCMAVYNNALYFGGMSASSNLAKLYRYDLVNGNVTTITELYYDDPKGAIPDYSLVDMQVYNSALYYSASPDSAKGVELYKIDGNVVSLVADLFPGSGSSSPSDLTIFNGNLYMSADDGVNGRELFRINGPTGIQSVHWNGEVKLYPNPARLSATLSITLKSTQSLRIALTDMAGREVFNTDVQSFNAGKHEIKLPMQSLAAGKYIYRINGNDGAMLANGAVVKQ